jgi:Icc-related predicted phosphoesterase
MDEYTVFVTHSPASGVLEVGILGVPAGSPAILSAVAEAKVRAHIHGHIHGSLGVHGCHYNVAASGRSRAVLLDVDLLESAVLCEPGGPA